jgi:hypothetical protein
MNISTIILISLTLVLNIYSLSPITGRLQSTQDISINKSNPGTSSSAIFITAPSGKSAVVNFRLKNSSVLFSLGLVDKEFIISNQGYKNVCIKGDKSVTLKGNSILSNSLSVDGQVKYVDKSQWRMVAYDSFNKNNTSLGWNYDKTNECQFYKMIGGYCQISSQEIVKEYTKLPPHTMVRIEGLYHFVGQWDSHTGYLKVDFSRTSQKDEKYVWSNRCKNQKSPLANIKLCQFDVCKIGSPINITLNHIEKNLKLIFGSTLTGNPCDSSYGVSDVRIYIR